MVISQVIKKYQDIIPNRKKGVNVYSMKKAELIHLIQKTEGNQACFKSDYSHNCRQTQCSWYEDCVKS